MTTEQFTDWKITYLFYVALHYLKALAASKGINIGSDHQTIESSVRPGRHKLVMEISREAWRNYSLLKQASNAARYEGFSDDLIKQRLLNDDHEKCLIALAAFRQYVFHKGKFEL